MSITRCQRCGVEAQGEKGDPSARIFRRAMKGHCTACHVVTFLKNLNQAHGGALFERHDPATSLRLPHVQEAFYRVMKAGNAEATPDEIDWDMVIAKWSDDHADANSSEGLFS